LSWLVTRRGKVAGGHFARDLAVSGLALVFSFWTLAGSGYQAVYYGAFCVFLGVPVYVWMKATRHEYGERTVSVPAIAALR
jgi:APA family basic amino acid/polyamine antiporter